MPLYIYILVSAQVSIHMLPVNSSSQCCPLNNIKANSSYPKLCKQTENWG